MKITINENGCKRIKIRIPTRLVISRLSLRVLRRHAREDGEHAFRLPRPRDMRRIRREVKRMKAIHPNWCLVEAASTDGELIEIRL